MLKHAMETNGKKTKNRLYFALIVFAVLCFSPVGFAEEIFTDEAQASGIDFVHFNGMSGAFYFVEPLGSGAALFDYDNDGDLDVYLGQGHMLGAGKSLADAITAPPPGERLRDRLYRNDLVIHKDGRRSLRFTEVTEASGLDARGYAMGAAVGDYDSDGWPDLYITNFGPDQLWRNNGDGTFADMTKKAGLSRPGWSVSGAFLDYDRDGHLDLYVGHYVKFSLRDNVKCFAPSTGRDYCSPHNYDALPDRLYRNRGDGSFEEVSAKSRIEREFGPALGVIVADFNGDGWVDIYTANDMQPNQLWINQKNGTFINDALLAGVAVNMEGAAEASMGVDAADFDGDGDEDLFMTHLQGETNTIYVNNGEGWFEDRSLATGLGAPSKAFTSFGTGWFDYDNNGWLDLFVANGEVRVVPLLARAGDTYPLHQTNQLFANLGGSKYKDITAAAGEVFELSEVSRGAAFGDVDNDGDTDILVTNNNGRARLLINHVGNRSHWLGLRVLDDLGRDAIGARVAVYMPKTRTLWRRVRTDGSYACANDPRLLVGMGKSSDIEAVRVFWPNGDVEQWQGLSVDRYTILQKGKGKMVKQP